MAKLKRKQKLYRKIVNGPFVLRCKVHVEVVPTIAARWFGPATDYTCPVCEAEWATGPTDMYGRFCSRACHEYYLVASGEIRGQVRITDVPIELQSVPSLTHAELVIIVQAGAHAEAMDDSRVMRAAQVIIDRRRDAVNLAVDALHTKLPSTKGLPLEVDRVISRTCSIGRQGHPVFTTGERKWT